MCCCCFYNENPLPAMLFLYLPPRLSPLMCLCCCCNACRTLHTVYTAAATTSYQGCESVSRWCWYEKRRGWRVVGRIIGLFAGSSCAHSSSSMCPPPSLSNECCAGGGRGQRRRRRRVPCLIFPPPENAIRERGASTSTCYRSSLYSEEMEMKCRGSGRCISPRIECSLLQ